MSQPGLDFDFLEYIGHDPAAQRAHQEVYLAFFQGGGRVVDLGCGHGEFVEMLRERGADAVGIDSDPVTARYMRERGLPVVEQDVLAYMRDLPAESIDGVFAAHLVEHLPFEQVLALIEHAARALRPSGVIVLATPDPRSLYAHLEMFYLHFGHVSFYHPRLLAFFMEHAGLADVVYASNSSPVQPASPLLDLPQMYSIQPSLPHWKTGLLWRALRGVRIAFAYVFLRPYLDMIQANFARLGGLVERLDRPFECYAKAVKPRRAGDDAG